MAVNETINASLAITQEATSIYQDMIVPFILTTWDRFIDLILAPYLYQNMVWIIAPLIFTICIMEFYFTRYKHEELGWNTAVGNSVVLIFVSIDLFRQIYEGNLKQILALDVASIPMTTICAGIIGIWGLGLMVFNFWHILPKRFSFLISSALPVNTTAYIAILLVYTNMATAEGIIPIPLDIHTILAALLLLIVLFFLFNTVAVLLIPESKDVVAEAVATAKQEIEEAAEQEKKRLKQMKKEDINQENQLVEEIQNSELIEQRRLQEEIDEEYNNGNLPR